MADTDNDVELEIAAPEEKRSWLRSMAIWSVLGERSWEPSTPPV